MTAHGDGAEDKTRVLHAGFTAHLSKPPNPSEMLAVVGAIHKQTLDADALQSG